jgi:hypothetical protein
MLIFCKNKGLANLLDLIKSIIMGFWLKAQFAFILEEFLLAPLCTYRVLVVFILYSRYLNSGCYKNNK